MQLGVLGVIFTVVISGSFRVSSCLSLLTYSLSMLDSENCILFSLKNLEVITLGILE